jgi:hypothetical protein
VAQVGVMALADACTVAMHTQLSAIREETKTCQGAHVPIHAPIHPPEKILENQLSLAGLLPTDMPLRLCWPVVQQLHCKYYI